MTKQEYTEHKKQQKQSNHHRAAVMWPASMGTYIKARDEKIVETWKEKANKSNEPQQM
jgi:hypothetical protein